MFIVVVLWSLLHGIVSKIGPVYGPPWIVRVCGFIRENRLSIEASDRVVQTMTKTEKALTFLLGIAVYIVFTLGRSLTSERSPGAEPRSLLDGMTSTETLLSAMALFVVMFSTLIIVSAIRNLIRRDAGEPKGEKS